MNRLSQICIFFRKVSIVCYTGSSPKNFKLHKKPRRFQSKKISLSTQGVIFFELTHFVLRTSFMLTPKDIMELQRILAAVQEKKNTWKYGLCLGVTWRTIGCISYWRHIAWRCGTKISNLCWKLFYFKLITCLCLNKKHVSRPIF